MPYVPIPSHTDIPHLRKSRRFKQAMDEAIELRGRIDAAEARIAELKTQRIEPELVVAGVEGRVDYNGWQVAVVDRAEGKKLNRKKLVVAMEARGYDTSVIDEALETTPGAHYVELRSPKDDDEGEVNPAIRTAKKVAKVLTR